MIKITVNGVTDIQLDKEVFPNGEAKYLLEGISKIESKSNIKLTWRFKNQGSDFLDLMTIVHSHQFQEFDKKSLYIPYVPFMRMDRNNGDQDLIVSSDAILSVINSMPVDFIYTGTLHSPLNERKFINEIAIENLNYLNIVKPKLEQAGCTPIVVLPDKGSAMRQEKLMDNQEYSLYEEDNIIIADKVRDFDTGKITSIKANIPEEVKELLQSDEQTAIVVIDDICSYGGTFIGVKDAIFKEVEHESYHVLCVAHLEEAALKGKVLDEYDLVVGSNSISDFKNNNKDNLIVVDIL